MLYLPIHPAQQKARRSPKIWRGVLYVTCVALACILFVNFVLLALWHNKVPHNVRLGNTSIAGLTYPAVTQLPADRGIESTIVLQHNATQKTIKPSQLGLVVDQQASAKNVQKSWVRWLPVVTLVHRVTVPVVLTIHQAQFDAGLKAIEGQFEQAPQDIHIAFNGSEFAKAPASDGYTVDSQSLQKQLLAAVADGRPTMQVPTRVIKATPHDTDLSAEIADLNKQLATTVSFATYEGTKVVPSTADRAAWYVPNGQSLAFSKEKVAAYLNTIAVSQKIALLNGADLTTATYYALTHQQKLDFRMVTTGNHLRTYCTAVRGVAVSNLDDLNDKLAAVYADVRGWNDKGQLGFEHVDSGCGYTVWLAASSQMTSFGSICDDYYNCQTGTNVVVNYDRWTTATPPWNQTGGNIQDYRVLIISHETGHRLGFYDNPTCPGPGQPAYVMMQQSIDLKGCVFNIWPTQTELDDLSSML